MKELKMKKFENSKTEVALWIISETCYKVIKENPYSRISSPYNTKAEAEEAFKRYCEKAEKEF